jgi:hypothetical protein
MALAASPGAQRRRAAAAVVAALLAAAPAAPAFAQARPGQIDVRIAHERSQGRYGEPTRTTIDQTTLAARYHGNGWWVDVQLPWLRVHSPGGSGLPEANGAGSSRVQGLGDVWWRGNLTLRDADAQGPGLDLMLKIKAATGSADRGLGSGGRDLALQFDLDQQAAGLQWLAHLGWRRTGDPAGFAPYRNPWYGGLAVQGPLAPAWEWGAGVDWRQPIGRLGPLGEATVHLAWRDGAQRWQLHLTGGWQRASPDAALGLTWRQRF